MIREYRATAWRAPLKLTIHRDISTAANNKPGARRLHSLKVCALSLFVSCVTASQQHVYINIYSINPDTYILPLFFFSLSRAHNEPCPYISLLSITENLFDRRERRSSTCIYVLYIHGIIEAQQQQFACSRQLYELRAWYYTMAIRKTQAWFHSVSSIKRNREKERLCMPGLSANVLQTKELNASLVIWIKAREKSCRLKGI